MNCTVKTQLPSGVAYVC